MTRVFADALFWIARVRPRDPWREKVRETMSRLGDVSLVTTDEVLSEFLAALSHGGPILRKRATDTVRLILRSSHVLVVPQTRDSFLQALDRYAARPDKAYSLTDCASMNAMDALSIVEVLTNDRHFAQEGYAILLK